MAYRLGVPLRPLTLTILAVALVAPAAGSPSTAMASDPGDTLGVYRGARNVGGVADFASWVGKDVPYALDFVSGESWSSIESPTWWTSGWAGTGRRVVFSIPILPDSGGSLQAGAAGQYNSHFVKLGENLVEHGHPNAIVRLGWEFNGRWYRWSAQHDPAAFAAYWRQIVTAMRTVEGQQFEFEWNPTMGREAVPADAAYPGDEFVDYIGLDVYDQSWAQGWQDPVKRWADFVSQPYGLAWHRDFAAAHAKPMTFPEWGVAIRDDGHGGGDNPYFIEQMYEWIRTNNVAYHMYFEFDAPDGAHALMGDQFPNSADAFVQLFGGDGSAADPGGGVVERIGNGLQEEVDAVRDLID
jgi:Glycosyl hydrolase family 26